MVRLRPAAAGEELVSGLAVLNVRVTKPQLLRSCSSVQASLTQQAP